MSKPVTTEYTELMHYTTAAGLAGIVSGGCLWATHAAFLNDAEEITHFFDSRLQDLAQDEMRRYVAELSTNLETAKRMEAEGGIAKIADKETIALVSRLRSATLSINQPHIFSMSTARDERIKHSGLLSQWRGYGIDGGYSVVFDTVEFEHLLRQEATSHQYQHVQWGDVFYYGVDQDIQPSSNDIRELEEIVRSELAILIREGTVAEEGKFYQAITSLSCLFKHWGFQEEREVRVIVVPVDADVAKLDTSDREVKPLKKINTFIRAGLPVPYIQLFAPTDPSLTVTPLPIKRVIIGPHRDSVIRKQAVQRLLASNGYDVAVVCSDIPYIGR